MQDKTIDYILRSTWMCVAKMYNEQAHQIGSTMSTGFALISIDPVNGTPSTSLGPKMGIESTSLSRTLKSMEDKGYIFRQKNPEDGRGILIHLTDLGKSMRDYSKNIIKTFDAAVKNHIEPDQLETFIKVAKQINNLVNQNTIYNSIKND